MLCCGSSSAEKPLVEHQLRSEKSANILKLRVIDVILIACYKVSETIYQGPRHSQAGFGHSSPESVGLGEQAILGGGIGETVRGGHRGRWQHRPLVC